MQVIHFPVAWFCSALLNLLFAYHAVSGQYRVVVMSGSRPELFLAFIRAISMPSRYVCFSVWDASFNISVAVTTSSLTIAETQNICFDLEGNVVGFEVAIGFEVII